MGVGKEGEVEGDGREREIWEREGDMGKRGREREREGERACDYQIHIKSKG